jgi:hypothetical protein
MIEKNGAMEVWLALSAMSVTLLALAILVLVFVLLVKILNQRAASVQVTKPEPKALMPTIVSPSYSRAANWAESKKTEKTEKVPKPGRACGHCGVKIKNDPVKEIVLEEQSYLVFECSVCKKQTALVQETAN